MTVFNSISKIGKRFVSELENLRLSILEKSKQKREISLETMLVDKSKHNTVTKLKRRTVSELKGLSASVVQCSFRECNATIDMLNECVDTTNYNTFNKILRRKYEEIEGLYINIIENSFREKQIKFNGIRVVKPIKKYKNKIKLLFKYSNNIKH